jgi:uncharacterized membrane protein YqjE
MTTNEPDEYVEARPGPMAALRQGAEAAAHLCRSRLELLLLDVEEEKERLEQRFVLCAIGGTLLTLGSLAVTAFFVTLLWPVMNIWAIAFFAVLYLGGAAAISAKLYHLNRERRPTFACTLQEFEKDIKRFAQILQDGEPPPRSPSVD